MSKIIRKFFLGILFSFLILLSGCQFENSFPLENTEIVIPTNTKTVPILSTSTETTIAELTPTPIIFPTYEPASQDELGIWLDEKLIQPECDLPCAWGVTPGLTRALDAYNIGAPFATRIYFDELKSGYHSISFHYDKYPIAYDDPSFSFSFGYKETYIAFAQLWDLSAYSIYDIQNILDKYGPPEEIWVRAWSPDPGWDNLSRASSIIFLFPSQHFMIEYWEGESEIVGEFVRTCLDKGPNITSWSKDYADFEKTYLEENYFLSDVRPYLRLEDLTGITPKVFYETFVNTTGDVCIETPLDTWLSSKSGEFD